MLAEVLDTLAPRNGGTYLDGTFGGGGYARAILGAADCTLWAIDRDPDAIARGRALAVRLPRLRMLHGPFGSMATLLAEAGVIPDPDEGSLDGVVLDLGVSSFQLDQADRGFSFRHDGPLDMRMARTGTSAADLVATLPEAELADLLFHYGEERASRRIARAVVAARAEAPITTTGRLAAVIRRAMPTPKRDRTGSGRPDGRTIDPATRSFQALRIRVNDELGEIERVLPAAAGLLRPGGRLVVVSFHSLEDRIVKRFMQDAAGRAPGASRHDPAASLAAGAAPAGFRLLASRALRPAEDEAHRNPRARSARLRILERLAPDHPGVAR
ncbi:MAG: 16S rRNA (cytosine(1402)-N(4))-methyltransferase RsmH [Gluconacetobacter diazotrophicus]|nr:16S rRNA (cytosine(1402)-N(4))-methyltransferase RsmH [Gluconacetobacter diazotrophicus]